MAAFTPSGSGGIPVQANIPGVLSPTLVNLDMSVASTEYSYTLPGDTRKFLVKLRDPRAALQLAYIVSTSDSTYLTVPAGNWYSDDELDTSAVVTLYIQSPSAGQILEILTWT